MELLNSLGNAIELLSGHTPDGPHWRNALVTIIIMELRSQWQSLVALHPLSDIDPGEKMRLFAFVGLFLWKYVETIG